MSLILVSAIAFGQASPSVSPHDPGPRGGPPSAGNPLTGLTGTEFGAFLTGKNAFEEIDSVSGTLTSGSGLGPRFNMDSCAGCHASPNVGGSSPAINPQMAVATKAGASNTIPSFITQNGPVGRPALSGAHQALQTGGFTICL
jgi:hypothetical protein